MCPCRRMPPRRASVPRKAAAQKTEQASVTEALTVSRLDELCRQVEALRQEVTEAASRNGVQQTLLDRLHAEVQEHRNGLLQKLQQPWVMGLVQVYDALNRGAKDLAVSTENMAPRTVSELLEEFRQDVEIVLEQQGIVPYNAPGDRFDPQRQTAIKTVPAPEEELTGLVLLRLRPGFEQDGRIVRKEWVCVYASPAKS